MKYFLLTLSLAFGTLLSGQNTIVKKDGERILCKVLEVTPEYIKFTKSQITNSPIFSLRLSDIDTVWYQSDYFEVINKESDLQTIKSEKIVNFIDPRDSVIYPLVKIGTQVWFAKNLQFDTIGATIYADKQANLNIYGRLYTFNSAKNGCPCGWHLPSDEEWKTLERHLGMLRGVNDDGWRGTRPGQGFLLKIGGTSGFNARFGGAGLNNQFWYIQKDAFFWTSTKREWNPHEAWIRQLSERASIKRDHQHIDSMLSVRCIRD